ncbi:MAG: hypothetical protein AB2556_12865 [Candidatus Thiodiazotropha sp.]
MGSIFWLSARIWPYLLPFLFLLIVALRLFYFFQYQAGRLSFRSSLPKLRVLALDIYNVLLPLFENFEVLPG